MLIGQFNTKPFIQEDIEQLHLYLAWACPFCHRVIAALHVTGLIDLVSISWMDNIKKEEGWRMEPGADPLFGVESLSNVYRLLSDKNTRASVPLLVDKKAKRLLSDDSSKITRFVTTGFHGLFDVKRNLIPLQMMDQINKFNCWLQHNINRKVYQIGFARSQRDYEEGIIELFQSLDALEMQLKQTDFLLGSQLTESDLYLFATLVRFDCIYFPLFKCNYKRIADYPLLTEYIQRLQQIDGISRSYHSELNREHYFNSVMHVDGVAKRLYPSQ